MNVVITLCLVGMALIVAVTILNIARKNREQRLKYYRDYKKGNFLFIYLISMPLYFIASLYSNGSVTKALFDAFKNGVELVVLKFDYDGIALLMQDSVYFTVAIWICYAIVVINTVFLAMTIFVRRVENTARTNALKRCKKAYVVVGFNDKNKDVISSIDNASCVLLVEEITEDVKNYAFIQKIAYAKIIDGSVDVTLQKLFGNDGDILNGGFMNKSVEVIINTLCDEQNLSYCEQVSSLITSLDLNDLVWDDSRGLNVYVFADPSNEQVFLNLTKKTSGCVHYINKYKLIAMDFVGNYPLTEYMNEEQIDYANATIKEDVQLNVALIGFGKTNQQIFLTSVANNQFLSFENEDNHDSLKSKLVNYYIYDKCDSRSDKNLNHNYFRAINELPDGELLPLPFTHDASKTADCKPADEEFLTLDINDFEFYTSLKERLVATSNKKYNYLVIAFGSDLQNLDFAEKICDKLKEWGADSYTHVFAKVRNDELKHSYVSAENPLYIIFGNEKELVYNVSQIVDEKTEAMAKDRHICYAMADMYKDVKRDEQDGKREGNIDNLPDEEKKAIFDGWERESVVGWYKQSQTQRESNIYAVLSLRMKLQLMGFDYVPQCQNGVEAEFLQMYQQNDPIEYIEGLSPIKGRRIEKYTLDFAHDTVRERLTVQEHQRWNAYMITCGFVPETIENMQRGRFKDFEIRRHSNLTTFDGLVQWRKIKAEVNGSSEEECDVIKYDYQLMDNATWLLNKHGYSIIKR